MTAPCPFQDRFTALFLVVFLAGCGGDARAPPSAIRTGQVRRQCHLVPPSAWNSRELCDPGKDRSLHVTGSTVTGDLGLSPAAASFITGFSLVADSTNVFSLSSSWSGRSTRPTTPFTSPSNLTPPSAAWRLRTPTPLDVPR